MARQAGNGGFTLLELLAGMAIFALIAGTAYAALSSASRIWETLDARSRADGEARLAIDYLRRQLAKAFPLAVPSGDRWQVRFEGGDRHVIFVVEGSRHVGLGGFYQMTVHHNAASSPPGIDLVLQHADDGLLMDEIGEIRETALRRVLLEDITGVEFTYFGRHDRNEEPGWYSEWRDMQMLPDLVRLRLKGGTIGEWPALTVRLPTDGLRFYRARSGETGLDSPPNGPIFDAAK